MKCDQLRHPITPCDSFTLEKMRTSQSSEAGASSGTCFHWGKCHQNPRRTTSGGKGRRMLQLFTRRKKRRKRQGRHLLVGRAHLPPPPQWTICYGKRSSPRPRWASWSHSIKKSLMERHIINQPVWIYSVSEVRPYGAIQICLLLLLLLLVG